jgi:hypothetical protein
MHTSTRRCAPILLTIHIFFGCAGEPAGPSPADPPTPANAADSLGLRIVNATGGSAAFQALPALRFDFVSVRDSVESRRNRHLWDRRAGRYRLEWTVGDSLLVALFSSDSVADGIPLEGQVYLDGAPLDSAHNRARLEEAYERFINDMYWLLAPLKVMDPGVVRQVASDSADASTDVLALSFADVGLTPGDRYWLHADRESGRLLSWSYVLESGYTGTYDWRDPRELSTPAGTLTVLTRKDSRSAPRSILTPVAPAEIGAESFTDPRPLLVPLR